MPRIQLKESGGITISQENYRRRRGDRREGRLLRSLAPLYKLTPYIMVTRNDACNQFSGSVDVTETDKWLREMRQQGYKGMGMVHMFIAAYIRVVSQMPGLNRFVAGQKIYARNDILVNMMVKRSVTFDAEETCVKVVFEPTDTVYDVYRRLNAAVEEIRDSDSSGTEDVAGTLMKIPGLILKFAIWIIKMLDYFDIMPRAILDASPFHGSFILTDLGSLGIPPIYHHLYNFGNLPLFLAFGAKRREVGLDKDGQLVERKFVDYKLVCDERIADGSYYAQAFKYLRYYLKNPQELEKPPEKVVEDVE